MSIKLVTGYVAQCDLCGRIDNEEYAAWADVESAELSVDSDDWEAEGGNHLCPGCVPPYRDEDDQ